MIHSVDLVVIDSTPGGLIAAVTAARLGLSVLVVTEDRHIGGMQTSGLGNTNAGQRASLSGATREFHERVLAWYVERYGADSPQVVDSQEGWHFESSVAEAVYEAWLEELGVEIWRERVIVGVEKEGTRVTGIQLEDGDRVCAGSWVDSSYEGDFLVMAGCSCTIGREAEAVYGESLAGRRAPAGELGMGDELTQAYDFRLCLTQAADRVAFREPEGYDPGRFDDWRAHIRRMDPQILRQVVPLNMMPNGKTDSRIGEWVGGCTAYPEASRAERERIVEAHRRYAEEWLWFVLTDEVIPQEFREELATWGYAADEFVDNDHWPYHIYVRQSRRLVGDWVMREQDVLGRQAADSVGIGSFYLDVHAVRTITNGAGELAWEGSLGHVPVLAYAIPYRVSLPKQSEAANVWATFVLSASHVAYSTLRMEPYFMQIGQAAGVAAALAQAANCAAAEVPLDELHNLLDAQGQVVDPLLFNNRWP